MTEEVKAQETSAQETDATVQEQRMEDTSEPTEDTACDQELGPEELQALVEAQREQIDRLQQESAALKDRLLRLQADFDNFRRRSREEVTRAGDQANERFFLELLPVVDNLERAVAAGEESQGSGMVAGVQMVLKQLQDLLARWEVQPIPAVGEAFDPRLHEAIMQVEAEDETESGTIVEQLQKGYTFKDKTLRASLVHVAK
ncbi:MAG: nucleotide exchange factor GrpE [Firmicutes bacterium]|nr:nucleotide exchange factor GrpE [Bacillota bacterium]